MKVEQLSIFLENKTGRLAKVTQVLAEGTVNILALSLADTSDFGILRLIVDDCAKARAVLKDNGFTVGITHVVAVAAPHKPGGLNGILQLLNGRGISVEYMYAIMQKGENAVLVIRLDCLDAAIEVLRGTGVSLLSHAELCGNMPC